METMLATILVFLLVSSSGLTDACSCMLNHPQQHYCTAGFVIKVTVLKQESQIDTSTYISPIYYRVRIDKVFKGDNLKEGLDVQIATPSNEGTCGNMHLQEGSTYLLTGRVYNGQLYHILCNLAIEWKQVSLFQRKGFRNFYKKSCTGCEISTATYRLQTDKQCAYEPYLVWRSDFPVDCEAKYSTCIEQSNAQCNWLETPAYRECVMQRRFTAEGSGFQ